jgi:hypothetical protein
MRPAGWNGTRVHAEKPRPEIYPGVFARVEHSSWHPGPGGGFWPGRVIFEGSEEALREAGLIRAGDRLPQKPGGMCGVATMRRSGELRLWMLDRADAAVRDRTFQRFMDVAISGIGPDDDGAAT